LYSGVWTLRFFVSLMILGFPGCQTILNFCLKSGVHFKPRKLADQVSHALDQQTSAQRQACIESAIQHSPQQHFVGHLNAPAVSFNVPHPSGQCEAFAQPTEPSDRPTVIYRNRKRQQQLTEMAQTRPWLFMGLKLVLRMRQFWRNQTIAMDRRFGSNPSKRRDEKARRARRH